MRSMFRFFSAVAICGAFAMTITLMSASAYDRSAVFFDDGIYFSVDRVDKAHNFDAMMKPDAVWEAEQSMKGDRLPLADPTLKKRLRDIQTRTALEDNMRRHFDLG